MTRTGSRVLAITALLIAFTTIASADITWTLNATFTDGMTATGTFTTQGGSSSVAPTFDAWNISFAGGTLTHNFVDSNTTVPPGAIGAQFPPNGSWPAATLETLFFAHQPGFDPYVDFYLATVLTDAGGTMTFVGRGADACDGTCFSLDATKTNSLVGVAVPEPSAVVLLTTVIGILGATTFRRRKRALKS